MISNYGKVKSALVAHLKLPRTCKERDSENEDNGRWPLLTPADAANAVKLLISGESPIVIVL